MKRMLGVLLCTLCLYGCGTAQTMETISDDLAVSADAVASQVELSLFLEEASVLEGEGGDKLYMCNGFVVSVQTLEGGDLDRSLQTVTGFSKDALTVMQTDKNGISTYTCAWCTTGEEEDQVCRTVILDDGLYHYAVTVMADYTRVGELTETWQDILRSVQLSTDSETPDTVPYTVG